MVEKLPERKLCSGCQAEFACGVGLADNVCWCETMPILPSAEPEPTCRCPECLVNQFVQGIDVYLDQLTLTDAVAYASRYRGRQRLVENIDYTVDAGMYVFSRWYLLKRGYCCRNGCRNCPYGNGSN